MSSSQHPEPGSGALLCSLKPIVLRLPSLVRRLENKVHMPDEWPYISGNTWPSSWLGLSLNSFKNSSQTMPKVWSMRQMQHHSSRSSGSKSSTQSCCAPPAVIERRERRSNNDHPIAWSRSSTSPFNGAAAQKHGRRKATDARFETMIKRSSWVDSPFFWFPAARMPLIIDALREKSCNYTQSVSQLGAVAFTTDHRLSYRRH